MMLNLRGLWLNPILPALTSTSQGRQYPQMGASREPTCENHPILPEEVKDAQKQVDTQTCWDGAW